MLDTFIEPVGRGDQEKQCETSNSKGNLQVKEIVCPTQSHTVLETRQGDEMFAIIHGLCRNTDRLFQQHRVDDPLCLISI